MPDIKEGGAMQAKTSGLTIACSGCGAGLLLNPEGLKDIAVVVCRACGRDIALPPEVTAYQQNRAAGKDPYLIGTWQRRRQRRGLLLVAVLATLPLLSLFVGGGRYNDTTFVGIKRQPGFEHTYVEFIPATAFGAHRMQQKVGKAFSLILVEHNRRNGLQFLQEPLQP